MTSSYSGRRRPQNTNDLQWKMRRQLQCKALQGRQKSRRRRNNGKQWKKQCAEQSKQSEYGSTCTTVRREAADILARAPRGHEKSPPISRGGRHSQKPETRIPAIADLARKCKRETKAFPLFPRSAACGDCAPARQDTGTVRFSHSRERDPISTAMAVSLLPIIAASATSGPRADRLPAARREPCLAMSL